MRKIKKGFIVIFKENVKIYREFKSVVGIIMATFAIYLKLTVLRFLYHFFLGCEPCGSERFIILLK